MSVLDLALEVIKLIFQLPHKLLELSLRNGQEFSFGSLFDDCGLLELRIVTC